MYQQSLLPSTSLADLPTKKSKLEVLREQLLTNDRWAVRGLIAIYGYQTAQEQARGETSVKNRVGFSAYDAQTMTALAQQVIGGRQLTTVQLRLLRPRIARYAKQLLDIAVQNRKA
jgi:hypothetical protein